MFDKLEDLLIRFEEIMGELHEPTVTNNQERFRKLMKEQSDLTDVYKRQELDSGIEASGILEVMPDGYGFIRCENYMPGENDVYAVSYTHLRCSERCRYLHRCFRSEHCHSHDGSFHEPRFHPVCHGESH